MLLTSIGRRALMGLVGGIVALSVLQIMGTTISVEILVAWSIAALVTFEVMLWTSLLSHSILFDTWSQRRRR